MQTCYVLAGICGGTMKYADGGAVLWVDYTRLALGKFGALRLDAQGEDPGAPDGEELEPAYPLERYYNPLLVALDNGLARHGYRTVHHAYDWRKRILGEAAGLADRIRSEAAADRPAVIVGHSLGGLIARGAWSNLLETGEHGLIRRIVTLGTPHRGSYAPCEVFSLEDQLVRQLAAVTTTVRHINRLTPLPAVSRGWSRLEVAQLAATWPAMYELMPLLDAAAAAADPLRVELFNAENWPASRELSQAHLSHVRNDFRLWLGSQNSLPPLHVLTTVAGTGFSTYGSLQYPDLLGDVEALGLADDGDGAVSVDSALVANSAQYSFPSRHADLPTRAATEGDIVQWVLEERIPPLPIPPRRRIVGPVVPLLAGPPLPIPFAQEHDC